MSSQTLREAAAAKATATEAVLYLMQMHGWAGLQGDNPYDREKAQEFVDVVVERVTTTIEAQGVFDSAVERVLAEVQAFGNAELIEATVTVALEEAAKAAVRGLGDTPPQTAQGACESDWHDVIHSVGSTCPGCSEAWVRGLGDTPLCHCGRPLPCEGADRDAMAVYRAERDELKRGLGDTT